MNEQNDVKQAYYDCDCGCDTQSCDCPPDSCASSSSGIKLPSSLKKLCGIRLYDKMDMTLELRTNGKKPMTKKITTDGEYNLCTLLLVLAGIVGMVAAVKIICGLTKK